MHHQLGDGVHGAISLVHHVLTLVGHQVPRLHGHHVLKLALKVIISIDKLIQPKEGVELVRVSEHAGLVPDPGVVVVHFTVLQAATCPAHLNWF